ncbi:MAG: O-methyltransferase [Bryobacteraceae bacterium]
MGRVYSWLARTRKPDVIVGFGSAFGVSGMYWLAGLEEAGCGELLSFEVNPEWAAIARVNLASLGARFSLTVGMFKDHIAEKLNHRKIGIAFIDAIHTSEFVDRQFEIVLSNLAPGGIVILDDIDFSPDMAACWQRLAQDERVASSLSIDGHIGVLETA